MINHPINHPFIHWVPPSASETPRLAVAALQGLLQLLPRLVKVAVLGGEASGVATMVATMVPPCPTPGFHGKNGNIPIFRAKNAKIG